MTESKKSEQEDKNSNKAVSETSSNKTATETDVDKTEQETDEASDNISRFSSGHTQNDGHIEITFAEKDMSAFVSYFPPMGDGTSISPELLTEAFEKTNIVFGLNMDAAIDAAMEANLNHKLVKYVEVAKGLEPIEEIPEHIELLPRFMQTGIQIDQKALKVDFKEISPFIMVKENEVIANLITKVDGVLGKDIHGHDILYPRRKTDAWEMQESIIKEGTEYKAKTAGRFIKTGLSLAIDPVLELKGNVDYHTGHIVFPGDILLNGAVKEGFKVHSGGSILCKDTLDATDVNTKHDLIVLGGIIGHAPAKLRIGRNLQTKFIQNCQIAVRGKAEIVSDILNTHCYVLGNIIMGDKGHITGGEIWSVHGIRAFEIGTARGIKTIIKCGTDFTVQQRLDLANERMKILSAKERKIHILAKTRPSPKLEQFLSEIKKTQAELAKAISEMLIRLDADENACVDVVGQIFPGTIIEICRVSITIIKIQKHVRFKLDKYQGKIVSVPLDKAGEKG